MRWHRASNTASVTNSFHLDIQRCLSKLGTKKKNPDIDIVTFFMSKNYSRKLSAAIFFQAQNFLSGTEYSVRDASFSWSCFCGNIVTWTAFCSMWNSEKMEQKYPHLWGFVYFFVMKTWEHTTKNTDKGWEQNQLAPGLFFTWKNPEEGTFVDFSFAILDSGRWKMSLFFPLLEPPITINRYPVPQTFATPLESPGGDERCLMVKTTFESWSSMF